MADMQNHQSENSRSDSRLWQKLLQATNSQEYVDAWLAIQCLMLPDVRAAVITLGKVNNGPFNPVAFWPDGNKQPHLAPIAEKTLAERKSYIIDSTGISGAEAGRIMSHPLVSNNALHGAVVIETGPVDDAGARERLRKLQWGCAWLDSLFLRQDIFRNDGLSQDLAMMFGMVSSVQEQETLYGAALKLVNEISGKLHQTRVSIGFRQGNRTRVKAVSHNAEFGEKNNLVKVIEAAMDETVDQNRTLRFPVQGGDDNSILLAHERLLRDNGMRHVVSLPLVNKGQVIGALTLESDAGELSTKNLEICRQILLYLSPFFTLKIAGEANTLQRLQAYCRQHLEKIFGPGYLLRKALLGFAIIVIAGLFLIKTDFRVTARAYLEGSVQTALVSPFDSFVASAPVSAGDIVEEGSLVVSLDDRDLRLELLRLQNQKQQLESQIREALSNRDRAETNILQAQADQVDTQMTFIQEQINRTRLYAPFRGVIVSGDLSQSLGAPLTKGELLFEIAPLDSYRIVLEVDDRDISWVVDEQDGEIVLSAFPDRNYALSVTKITPVATASEGRNFFRVEAQLTNNDESLRPGMEGIAKVTIEPRSLIWIWTRRLVEWFRLWSWSWLP